MTTYLSPQWIDVARVLVRHSTAVQKGDRCVIIMREADTFPLMRAVYQEIVRFGGLPQVLFKSSYLESDLMRLGTQEQVEWVPELYAQAMDWADVCIDLRGTANLYEAVDVNAGAFTAHRRAEGAVSSLRTRKTRWTICRVPNDLFGQQARITTQEAMDLFFRATTIDWEEEKIRLDRLRDRYNGTREVRIETPDTNLVFSTAGRTFIVDDGHINNPGGEIFTAPVEDSVSGHISFSNPGVFGGVLIEGIRLRFVDGRVTDASTASHEDLLFELLDMDEGSRRVGEFGIGTNRMIQSFSNDIFYDEKIAGTIHIALGRSYSECGGKNDSALHWDIVKDLRPGGVVYFDDKPLIRDGDLLEQ